MRNTIDLNGIWKFAIDQDPEYHKSYDYSKDTSLMHWEDVTVPGCWNKYSEKYDIFEGVAWFVKEFDLETLPDNPICLLRFGGVNYIADVLLNGQKVGTHEGGYTAFNIDVSSALKEGRNRLAVRVDNRHLKIRLPAVLGWYNYGGIHRDVCLTITSGAQVSGVKIFASPEGGGAEGEIKFSFVGRSEGGNIRSRINDPSGMLVWEGEGSRFSLDKAEPWSPESPRIYRCETEIVRDDVLIDSISTTFGVRSIETRGDKILLNGSDLYLNGMCYLYDDPDSGLTFDPQTVKRDLDDLQALGVNCLRSHFPAPDMFLDECDRRGMMLWLEVPIYCIEPPSKTSGSLFSEGSVQSLAVQMLTEMVEQAASHPSVIIWSVGNECNSDHPESVAFFKACVEQVRSLDPTRLIGYASLYGKVGCLADMVDVVGINEYWGWYELIYQEGLRPAVPPDLSDLEKCLAERSEMGKTLLITEFGADSEPGFRSESFEFWSEDYHAALISQQYEIAAKYPAVRGMFPFLYADYRDPSKRINDHWHGINLKGVVDYQRNRKLPWESVRDAYRKR